MRIASDDLDSTCSGAPVARAWTLRPRPSVSAGHARLSD